MAAGWIGWGYGIHAEYCCVIHANIYNELMQARYAINTTQGNRKITNIQLSDAIDSGLATLACNERPEGWRLAEFDTLFAYVSPECPEILGELLECEP